MSLLVFGGRGRTAPTPPSGTPSIDGSADSSSYIVNENGIVEAYITLSRTDYTDTVTVMASGLPTGVTASYPDGQTYTGGTTQRRVRLTASSASLVTDDAIVFTLSGSGVTSKVINCTLTVQATPTWAPNLASVSSGLTEWFDEEMSQLDATTEFPSPAGNRIYGISGYKQAGGAAYGTHVYRHAIPGNSYGEGVGNGKMENETLDWKRMYLCIDVTLEGSGGDPYRIHFNEEKFLFPVAYIDGGGVANSGVDLAWILDGSGNWASHFQNGLGDSRATQTEAVYPVNDGSVNIIEHYLQVNTVGNSDGVWKMWVNGVLASDYSNLRFYDDAVPVSMRGFRLVTVRGGGTDAAPTPAGGQARVHSRIEIWTSSTIS